ncbi:hypothetical protein SAMN05192558_12515 [Actinokineospora alba]|uniref:Uncharacterized protein n=1 Tax=Actinokineospora alba TaxID=504798 RepID=A0A1H0WNF4_9PSEU|nr:hypothetical protein [Actinokineospora alba]TDP67165.1 hypothetical protein C8E96_2690 [Actinokineospora alba]SDJ53661.1 hypothetical protein SAMN05421871_11915 [Actinokineospora alba]SDP91985.1 hypothetical protein SAMN05192558_12515 [Actinokineospora alba]
MPGRVEEFGRPKLGNHNLRTARYRDCGIAITSRGRRHATVAAHLL